MSQVFSCFTPLNHPKWHFSLSHHPLILTQPHITINHQATSSKAAPFLTIIFMHLILLILAAWVVCHASAKPLKASSSAPTSESEASTEVDTAQSTPTVEV